MDDYLNPDPDSWLELEPETVNTLGDVAKWARFLAVVVLIFLGLLILGGAFRLARLLVLFEFLDSRGHYNLYRVCFLLITCIALLFPLIRMLRFSTGMQQAIKGTNQAQLNKSLERLGLTFRFLGIMTIVFLIFYFLVYMIKSTL